MNRLSIIILIFLSQMIYLNAHEYMIFLKKEIPCSNQLELCDVGRFAGYELNQHLKDYGLESINQNSPFLLKEDIEKEVLGQFPEEKIKFFGPDTLYFTHEIFKLNPEKIYQAVEKALYRKTGKKPPFIEIDFRGALAQYHFDEKIDKIKVKPGKIKYNNINQVKVLMISAGEVAKQVNVPVYIKIYDYYYTVRQMIKKGTELKKSDLVKKLFPVKNYSYKVLGNYSEIEGSYLKKNLSPGEIIFQHYFHAPIYIKKNSIFQAVYRQNEIVLAVKLKALENGKLNEVINALNMNSKKVVQVKVLGENQGEIIL